MVCEFSWLAGWLAAAALRAVFARPYGRRRRRLGAVHIIMEKESKLTIFTYSYLQSA